MLFTSLLSLLALQVLGGSAVPDSPPLFEDDPDDTPTPGGIPLKRPQLNAMAKTTFPDMDAEAPGPGGVRLVNGRPTRAFVEVTNKEAVPIQVVLIAGFVARPNEAPLHESILHNLTAVQYNHELLAGQTRSFTFSFALDMHPQHVRLRLAAVAKKDRGGMHELDAHDGVATIVEAPTSFLDPQIIFLYLVLSASFAATLLLVYKTWIEALFPQARRGKFSGGGKRAKKTAPDADAALSGSESTGAGTGSKAYDESWIPEHHIHRPVAKRVRSTPKKKGGE